MNKFILLIISYLANWDMGQIFIVIVGIFLIKKYNIYSKQIAMAGFILLFITMLFSIFQLDMFAGKIAEFVWILFTISFVQEFYHFLKYENK